MVRGASQRAPAVIASRRLTLAAGQEIHITALGGSITAADQQMDGLPWPDYVYNYLTDQYGANLRGTNGAVGGTRSSYMSVW